MSAPKQMANTLNFQHVSLLCMFFVIKRITAYCRNKENVVPLHRISKLPGDGRYTVRLFLAFAIAVLLLDVIGIFSYYYIRDLKRQITDFRIREVIRQREEAMRYQLLLDQIKQQGAKTHIVDELQPLFCDKTESIRQRYPQLTDLDINVLLLIGLGIDNNEILHLTGMSKRTYYKRRQLIAQRIGTTAAQLDPIAKELLYNI